MEGLLDPIFKEVVQGRAEVRELFRVPKVGTIAGSYVTDGKIARSAGLNYVYIGNCPEVPDGETTFCPGCKKPIVERGIFSVQAMRVAPLGARGPPYGARGGCGGLAVHL